MGFDINKPYRTRGGQKAWATSTPEELLVGWTKDASGTRTARLWYDNGESIYGSDGLDLVNVPERRTVKVWINVYGEGSNGGLGAAAHATRDSADRYAEHGRIACIEREIECTVGEGL